MATDPRNRQLEAYGGVNWGSAFFGWLVAVGLGALLTALIAAAGVAIELTEFDPEIDPEDEEVGIGGAVLLLLVALGSYFAGGYVAGRMSRFDGARQGLGVWIWGVVIAIILAILVWIGDQEWGLLGQLDLPRIPADETVTGLGIAVLIVILLGTLLAAMAGGTAGVRYHERVDEAAAVPARDVPEEDRTARDRPAPPRGPDEGDRPPPS